jgi:hypothetical protein
MIRRLDHELPGTPRDEPEPAMVAG